MLNCLLRCMFIAILAYILVSSFFNKNIIEGLETKKKKQFATYKKDPIQMATKNEENIKVLREEVNSIKKIINSSFGLHPFALYEPLIPKT